MCLIERRNKMGRTYVVRALLLDRFRVSFGRVEFDDLGGTCGFVLPRSVLIQRLRSENQAETHHPISEAVRQEFPAEIGAALDGSYSPAIVTGDDPAKSVIVDLRKEEPFPLVVGTGRTS